MNNEYEKYFTEKKGEWHENKKGIYHVSAIGCSHKDLEPNEHSGPCLRSTFWDYFDPEEKDLKSVGNFRMGDILHEITQEIYKINEPNCVVEFPIVLRIGKDYIVKGSVDLIDFGDKTITDFKTASMFTFPSSEYDYRPTHISQVLIYTALLEYWIFKDSYFKPTTLRIVYIKKHNLETIEMDIPYDWDDISEAYVDFLERVEYLHECITVIAEPKAEPHKWCKFCPYLDKCLEQEDIKAGKKKGWYVLNVVD